MNESRVQSGDLAGIGGERPLHPGDHVPAAQWNDWRWQLSHRLTTVDDFAQILDLTAEEVGGLSGASRFRAAATPYFASLMHPKDPQCPIRRQVVPTVQETAVSAADLVDSLGEDAHSPAPGLVHRYPDRVLMLVTNHCASICRFCTRNRMVEDARAQFDTGTYERQLSYIAATP